MAYPGKIVPGMLREVLRSSKLPINAQIHNSPKSTVFEPASYSPKVDLGINLLTYKTSAAVFYKGASPKTHLRR